MLNMLKYLILKNEIVNLKNKSVNDMLFSLNDFKFLPFSHTNKD